MLSIFVVFLFFHSNEMNSPEIATCLILINQYFAIVIRTRAGNGHGNISLNDLVLSLKRTTYSIEISFITIFFFKAVETVI